MTDTKARVGAAFFRFTVISGLALMVGVIVITLLAIVTYLNVPTFTSALLSSEVLYSIRLTLITTTITTILAMTLSIPAAYVLSRYRLPFHALIDTILD